MFLCHLFIFVKYFVIKFLIAKTNSFIFPQMVALAIWVLWQGYDKAKDRNGVNATLIRDDRYHFLTRLSPISKTLKNRRPRSDTAGLGWAW